MIAVDGVDGSGKTTFASRLACAIDGAGRPAIVVHEDDFLASRETRHSRGRDSPEGFFRDSYDVGALIRHVVDPLRPGGDRRVRRRTFDHRTDAPVDAPVEDVPVDAVVIVEGMFLHRDELMHRWDWSVFLDVPFTETARRMAQRDGTNPDPEHPTMRRYVEGQRIYLATCRPHERATVVVDNTSPLASEAAGRFSPESSADGGVDHSDEGTLAHVGSVPLGATPGAMSDDSGRRG